MSDPIDLASERRARATCAAAITPRDALQSALEALDAGEIEPSHIIVVHYDDEGTGFFRGGKGTNVVWTGILHRAIDLIWKLA